MPEDTTDCAKATSAFAVPGHQVHLAPPLLILLLSLLTPDILSCFKTLGNGHLHFLWTLGAGGLSLAEGGAGSDGCCKPVHVCVCAGTRPTRM